MRATELLDGCSETETEATGVGELRVVFVSDAYRGRNGTGTYYPDLVAQLSPRLSAVELIQPATDGEDTAASIPMPGDPTQRLAIPAWGRIERAMQRVRPNIVIAATPGPFGLQALRAARRHGSVLLSGYHTDFIQLLELYWGPLRKALVVPTLRRFQHLLWRSSDAVLVNAGDVSTDLQRLGVERIELVGTPLPAEFILTEVASTPESLKRVCFIGRFAREKRLDSVIQAARDCPDIHFIVAGDGPLNDEVAQAAAELANLEQHGWLSRAQVAELLDSSDLLVLPSKSERFGSIALEAMSRGRPALVSMAAGIHDWPELRPGLFRLEPDESLSRALRTLRAKPAGYLAGVGWQARQAAWNFNVNTSAGWISMLESLKVDQFYTVKK